MSTFKKNSELLVHVFAYKGNLGISMDYLAEDGELKELPECLLNDPTQENQLGMVCKPEGIRISPEAIELIKSYPREGGSFAPLMIDENSFGYMGALRALFPEGEGAISRDCDLSILDKMQPLKEGFVIPKDFIEACES